MPTIKEIAKRLNVSVSTVSRAINNHPRIGLRTKMRVQELAKELGYEPNIQAINFKQKKTYIIGVVLPFIREEFFSQAISGIENAAMKHHYAILFGQSYDSIVQERIVVEAMKKQRVDGIIISLSKETSRYDHLEALKKYDIPVVYFDRLPELPGINKVICDLHKGTIEMVNWLFSKGYRRVALINGPEKMPASKDRLSGYIEGIVRQRLKVDMKMVENSDLTKDGTNQAMSKLLSLRKAPQAIITFNDYVHMDAVQYAHKKNIQINKDLLFLSFANLPITGYTAYPPVVSIEQYPYRQGEKAMGILMKILNEKAENKVTNDLSYAEEIPVTLVIHH